MEKTTNLHLKTAIAVGMVSLVSACGGSGNGGSNALESSRIPNLDNSPLVLNGDITHTVDSQDNMSYFNIARIEPTDSTAQSQRQYGYSEFQLHSPGDSSQSQKAEVAKFDWNHEKTFTRDLIRFADTEENLIDYSTSTFFVGVTEYGQNIPVSLNGESISLNIFGLRNKTDDKAFILFDQYSGLVSGGNLISGAPSGNQTYRGYNLFRYTPHSEGYDARSLQDGTFVMEADFSAGTGSIQANSVLSNFTTIKGTKLSGKITIDTENGVFASRELRLTEVNLTDTKATGLDRYVVSEGSSLPARIQGLFHGTDGQGVSGIYEHDVESKGLFRGGIVGSQNFKLDGRPWRLYYEEFCPETRCIPGQ